MIRTARKRQSVKSTILEVILYTIGTLALIITLLTN